MSTCVHCDEAATYPYFQTEDVAKLRPFCCVGCMTVFQVLHSKGLSAYYDIKNNRPSFKRRSPVENKKQEYTFLDGQDFQKEYVQHYAEGRRSMDFYLEGIHCLACLWLIEKLPEFVEGVVNSKLDLERSCATITVSENGLFSKAAIELNELGYRPHPMRDRAESSAMALEEERSSLKRIGIAGAAAGNIMIYAIAIYAGAPAEVAVFFNALTVAFAVPVLTFSAWPFYQSAYTSLRNRRLSIDFPISVALILGGVMGILNLRHGQHENYFDSLCALVFLLLLSRYFLRKIQENGLRPGDMSFLHQSETVVKKNSSGEFTEAHIRSLVAGDIVRISPDEFFPADGIILEGSSRVNLSLLTGESSPVKLETGDAIYSGTQNLDGDIIVRTTLCGSESRLGSILRQVETGWASRSRISDFSANAGTFFTIAVTLLSLILFFLRYPTDGFEGALIQAITLLIVTCPCALALSVPLTFHRSLSLAAKNGIIIKNEVALEKLNSAENIFFDKTGTLTVGHPQLENFECLRSDGATVEDAVYSLELKSRHPVAVALKEFLRPRHVRLLEVSAREEIPGHGIKGMIDGNMYEINRDGVFRNCSLVATFHVRDLPRPESTKVLRELMNNHYKVSVLSGDCQENVDRLATDLRLGPSFTTRALLRPEEKVSAIPRNHSVMIGDGANDSLAMQQASVGIAVSGSMEVSLRAADIYLVQPGIEGVAQVMTLAKETMKVIHRNLVLSVLYNITSVGLVFSGHIHPLVAAIIMPVSSLTVLLSSFWGTKQLRTLWKS